MVSSGEPSVGRKRKYSQGHHHFDRVSIRDNAKAHLGDSYHFGVDDPLRRLLYAEDAPFNSYANRHHSDCLPNTRASLLSDIYTWADNKDSSGVFWLSGLAGTGKSTIARTVAHEYDKGQRLAASFFFSRGGRHVGDTSRFITTIAIQLARNVPAIRKYISDAVDQHADIVSLSLRHQWDHLVLSPLSNVSDSGCPTSLVLVVDALDECDSHDDIRLIVRLLTELQSKKGICLRVLLTSRPEVPIRCEFAHVPDAEHQDFVLHKISRFIVDDDISRYLEYNLGKFAGDRSLDAGWPGADIVRQLVQKASGLFIWAATAFRFIEQGKQLAPKRLHKLLCDKNTTSAAPEKHLDDIYTMVLINSLQDFDDEEKEDQCAVLKDVLGCIVLLFSPLSSQSLDRLLGAAEGVRPTLHDLHAILDVPDDQIQPLRLHHPSFRDFLLSKHRCGDSFCVDEERTHEKLAHRCLELMSAPNSLRQDICNLSRPGVLRKDIDEDIIAQNLPPEIQYACRYWVDHLERSGCSIEDGDSTHQFLNKHLLHWLEAMSLLNETSLCGKLIARLKELVMSPDSTIASLLHDISRFTLRFILIIADAPLQIYSSALVFSPEASIVRKIFVEEVPQAVELLTGGDKEWDACRSVLEGHIGEVTAVAFSHDGKLLASASYDRTIRVWETATATCQYELTGHSGIVRSVAFSRNGDLLFSASDDGTARVWEVATGTCCNVLEGYTHQPGMMVFAANGERLASLFEDNTVRVWEMATGNYCSVLKGDERFTRLAFSTNGKLLALVSENSIVRVWDTTVGKCVSELKDSAIYVSALALSVDGQLLASGSNRTVRVWDTATRKCLHVLYHEGNNYAAAFSQNGKLLASADGKIVRVWDTATGTCLIELNDNSAHIAQLAFSVDGQLLASASDKTVRVWEVTTATRIHQYGLKSRTDTVGWMRFSADGKLLAIVSDGRVVEVWETKTGTCCQELQGNGLSVMSMSFSADGTKLASGYEDARVLVWDVTSNTKNCLYKLQHHSGDIFALAFSADGKLLASGSSDTSVRVWELAGTTANCLHELQGHSGDIFALDFSADGKLLASGSDDATVRVWKTSNVPFECSAVLLGHSAGIFAVALSRDGRLLVSVSQDRTARVWDTVTGDTITQLKSGDIPIVNPSFSPDGSILHTSIGDISLASTIDLTWPVELAKHTPHLFITDQWITYDKQRLLWLPFEFRVTNSSVCKNVVGIGCYSGRVLLLKFHNLQ